MKQTIFMAALTLVGALGAFWVEPFVGVAVYYFFAVLRPQYLWKWALPEDIGWSSYVAWATLVSTLIALSARNESVAGEPRFSFAHKAYFGFGAWLCLTYITSYDKDVAWTWLQEYIKIFIMFGVGAITITRIKQVWVIYLAATGALVYIAYEMNFLYFTEGRLDIYHNGYGGLDNNGAALMLAMGVPLALFAWEATAKKWRWLFIAALPLLLHAVFMSYSRGAMVSLIVVSPILLLRSRKKRAVGLLLAGLIALVPYMAGNEIQARFYSVEDYNVDESANSRFDSWNAAYRIANDYPIFGVGIRNSNLVSAQYGADEEGRAIHSQYLQILADSGYPGLFFYLLAVGSMWLALIRTRRFLAREGGEDAQMARSMLNGIEGALVVFSFGSLFLSLEVFELPYLVALLAAQISLVARVRVQAARSRVPATAIFATPHQKAS